MLCFATQRKVCWGDVGVDQDEVAQRVLRMLAQDEDYRERIGAEKRRVVLI